MDQKNSFEELEDLLRRLQLPSSITYHLKLGI